MLSQIIAVTGVNIRSIPARFGSSTVAVIGIAGVVLVFVAVLSIAEGVAATMKASGDPGMLIPSVRIGISTQRKITKLRVARTRTRTAVRRGWRPKTRRRVRVARESGSTLECSMLNVSVFHAPQRASAPVWTVEHHGLSIEDTRFTRETPDYKFVPSQLMLKADC